MAIESDSYVTLRGGLCVPVAPIMLLLDLERRGFKVTRDGQDLVVFPPRVLSDDERAELRRWKPFVLQLLDYQPEAVQ